MLTVKLSRRVAYVSSMMMVLLVGARIASAQYSLIKTDRPIDQAIHFVYDFGDGSLTMLAFGLDGVTTTSINSASSIFDPTKVSLDLLPFPDQNTGSSFFKLSAPPVILTEINFDAGYLPSELSCGELLADLTVSGSLFPAGGWQDAPGGGPYMVCLPEPSTWLMLAMALPLLGRLR